MGDPRRDDLFIPDRVVEYQHRVLPGQGEVRVEVERGQRGGYGWSIKIAMQAEDVEMRVEGGMRDIGLVINEAIQQIDRDLRQRFGVGQVKEE